MYLFPVVVKFPYIPVDIEDTWNGIEMRVLLSHIQMQCFTVSVIILRGTGLLYVVVQWIIGAKITLVTTYEGDCNIYHADKDFSFLGLMLKYSRCCFADGFQSQDQVLYSLFLVEVCFLDRSESVFEYCFDFLIFQERKRILIERQFRCLRTKLRFFPNVGVILVFFTVLSP